MIVRRPDRIRPSEITDRAVFEGRRKFLKAAGIGAAAALVAPRSEALDYRAGAIALPGVEVTPEDKAKSYNNFYELGTDKMDPFENNGLYEPKPWEVRIHGEVAKPATLGIEEILKLAPLEERVYRLRCVEAWSMVIPWIGYSFSHIANVVEPTGAAKYVKFVTFNPEDLFPDDANRSLEWPYVEGLRMDEAMHPLTLVTLGMYGDVIPTQSGAPVRMMIPWKYGFKSGKAIVDIEFTREQPANTWNVNQPSEYGFYANVNPEVSHPRWSQASERAIGAGFFPVRRDTEIFNGYADEVASLYSGMDLETFF